MLCERGVSRRAYALRIAAGNAIAAIKHVIAAAVKVIGTAAKYIRQYTCAIIQKKLDQPPLIRLLLFCRFEMHPTTTSMTIRRYIVCQFFLLFLQQAALAQQPLIAKWAAQLLGSPALRQAHTGICIYEPATRKYWYRYQDNKYFMPASNTKIFTLYAGLRLLGDSLPALRYLETDTALYVKGTGDPAFLHPDYTWQPAMQLLAQTNKPIVVLPTVNENRRFGPGWAWSDYADYYQPELNEWPMYGNVARIHHHKDTNAIYPRAFDNAAHFSWRRNDSLAEILAQRDERSNYFTLQFPGGDNGDELAEVPFITGSLQDVLQRLQDTLHKPLRLYQAAYPPAGEFRVLPGIAADSLFLPMMHRSDNFFAEQTLMMCAAKLWDTISTEKVIDYMQRRYLGNLPDTPNWVDGSGLSRYNLFTPRDFVSVLTDMYRQYPAERLYNLFPTGGKGTLKHYYRQQFVHAKTGTLSGCVALSGYLVTRKKKTLVFSVLVNNHNNSATNVRREVERLLTKVWEQY